ncbi:MAG: 50S ribosomal protein L24 [Alphaproteobacteria bacterium]
MAIAKIKKGDQVIVIAGKDKGKTGEVLQIIKKENRAIVQGVNVATKHQKPTMTNAGGIVNKELAIDLSNIAIVDPKNSKATRIGIKEVDGKKVRFAKSSGEVID